MNLYAPLTVTPPVVTLPNGKTITVAPFTLEKLDITIIDNEERRTVHAAIHRCPRPLVLWQGDAYDAVGNWTQEQAEARITELLGSDPAAVLAGLFSHG